MRKLKVNEEALRYEMRKIINHYFLGIDIKTLTEELKKKGFYVSPQIIRRNIDILFNERKFKYKQKHGKKNNT